ncbi:MAG: Smr/MutS family protein [Bacilli bacterium]|nr:Smr/MutS family protein [Bacilli bacterium]
MNIYDLLEFSRIKEAVKNFTKTELGAIYAENITSFDKVEDANVALNLLNETDVIFTRFGTIPLSQSHNLTPIIEEAKRGNILTPHDFYLISADILNITKVNYFLNDKLTNAPLLKKMLERELDIGFLAKEIDKIITPNLLIKDSASHELARIRKSIVASEDRLTKAANSLLSKYGSYLAEPLITQREGHFVIPLKTSHKNKVDGIIYDISNSGQTIFVEPSEIAMLNNTLIAHKNDEIIEINRILRALTLETLQYEHQIINNNILLAELDLLFAKAQYGQKIKGMIPTFKNEIGLAFKDARHPLIDSEVVVANTFNLKEDKYIIVISGPNAGGKTVALKTMGLLVVMAKSGLMLPVSAPPTLYFYENVYASIGDEQSLSQNLSTFSSHVKRIGEIINSATHKDLVLLDELATGTSPEEGEALALAVTSYLLNAHISSVISSHYSRLKEFAYKSHGIINASMAFDEELLLPLYRYREEVPGRSYGLVVAKRFGIPETIIKEAESILSAGVYDFEATIGKLRHELLLLEDEKIALNEEKIRLEKKESTLDKELFRVKEEQRTFKAEKHERLQEEIEEAIKTIDTLIKDALQSGGKAHEIIELKKEVSNLLREAENFEDESEFFEVGDYVEIKSLHVKGEITRIKGDIYTIMLNSGKHMKVKASDISLSNKSPDLKKKPVVTTALDQEVTSVKPEINVIGMRVDEALAVLQPYLDRALLKRYPSVRIIHGFGSGALRRGIHDYLKTVSYVKSFALAGQFEGQGGATIVYFS